MIAGFLLILAVLVVGGAIAYGGDHVATKIGRKKLSLFNLRPKDTAKLVAVFTGVMAAAASMALVTLFSERVRVVLFEYDTIQARLNSASKQKEAAEKELQAAQVQRAEVHEKLQAALTERRQTETRLTRLRGLLSQVLVQQAQNERKLAESQRLLTSLEGQKQVLRRDALALLQETQALRQERRVLEARLTRYRSDIAQLDRQKRQLQIANIRLNNIANDLETKNISLRSGDVVYRIGEIVGKAKIPGSRGMAETQQIFNAFLSQLDQKAISDGARPVAGTRCRYAVCITEKEARALVQKLTAPGEHVLQLRAVDSSLKDEPVWVAGDVRPNKVLFQEGQIVATSEIDGSVLGEDDKLRASLTQLFSDARSQALKLGISLSPGSDKGVGEFSRVDLEQMISELKKQPSLGSITLQAVAKKDVDTYGPLKLTLIAVQNGRIISKAG